MNKGITHFQVLPGRDFVDPQAGVIRGVSVMTKGPALGHGILVDDEGLKQCLAACQARGSVRLIDRHDAEFEGIVGAITNFRIDGDQVKGDAELFQNHPMRERILEIAQKIPSEFGLSVESSGEHAASEADKKTKLFRCEDVDAVALVPRPAANGRGLFSARPVDTPARSTNKPMSKLKSALTQFAKLCKLEEGDVLDNVIDAVVEAVGEGETPTIEDRLKKLEDAADPEKETSMAARLAKLEEGDGDKSEDDKEEKDDKSDDSEAKLSKILDSKLKKFSADIDSKLSKFSGLSSHPGTGGGFQSQNDTKTKFEAVIATQLSAGAPSRAVAISRLAKDKPEIYNAARTGGLF